MGGGPADFTSKITSENNGEATEMICSALGEGAVSH